MKGSHKKTVPMALFDISSSSVGGAHVLVTDQLNDTVTILAEARADAPLQEDLNIDRFVKGAIKNLVGVIERVTKADTHRPELVQLVLASPWYMSQTRTIVYKKDSPFTCTQKLIDGLIQKEIDYVMSHEMDRFGAFGKEGVIVERQLSLIKLNGYSTTQPLGKKAQIMELFLVITVAPKSIIDQFTEVIHRYYNTRTVGVTTSPFTTYIVARDHFNASDEGMIIDVGEEVTDIAFIKDNLFLYQHSFPVGTYELYRQVSEKGNHTVLEAQVLLESFRLDKLAGPSKLVIEKAIITFTERWQSSLQKILDEGHYGFCLPDECYISADPRFEQIFTAIIKTDPFIQHTCSRGKVQPIFINSALLASKITTIDGTDPDISLATISLFIKRLV